MQWHVNLRIRVDLDVCEIDLFAYFLFFCFLPFCLCELCIYLCLLDLVPAL